MDRTAKVDVKMVVGMLVLIILLGALVPTIAVNIVNADASVLECNDPATPTLNESTELCTNASGVGVVNATPTKAGLSTAEEVIIGLATTFLVLAVAYFGVKKSGLA